MDFLNALQDILGLLFKSAAWTFVLVGVPSIIAFATTGAVLGRVRNWSPPLAAVIGIVPLTWPLIIYLSRDASSTTGIDVAVSRFTSLVKGRRNETDPLDELSDLLD
jgi:hypothetical protein